MRVGRGRWRRKMEDKKEGGREGGREREGERRRKGVKGGRKQEEVKWRMRKGKKIEKRQLNKLLKNHYKVKSHKSSTG